MNSKLIDEIRSIVHASRSKSAHAVDHQRVLMYWQLGKRIFEEEQQGKDRADYGAQLIKYISRRLQPEFGSGFSVRNLHSFRKLYRTFPIVHALRTQFSWTHYRKLISIDSEDKRAFYIAKATKNHWSARQLERQVDSQLYERLLLSNTKEDVLAVARNDRHPVEPGEIIKDPMFLEFLDLKREASYYERDLEQALITHLQDFLLELGNGFAFIARQRRIHLEGDDFFVDLVLYNRLLQCFVIVEIKTHKLTHQDIGQLQMYVNYFDRVEKLPRENKTIGILLCAEKNHAVVRFLYRRTTSR